MRFFTSLLLSILAFSINAAEPEAGEESYFPQQLTAKDLLLACNSSSLTDLGRKRQHYCLGFVSGVEEGLRIFRNNREEAGSANFCIPSKTRSKQLVDAFNKYAVANQTDLSKPAALMIFEALRKSFPCP